MCFRNSWPNCSAVADLNTGRLDSRFSGPMYDALTEYGESDPQSDAISGAFTAAFNSYVKDELKFTQERLYLPGKRHGEWSVGLEAARPGRLRIPGRS